MSALAMRAAVLFAPGTDPVVRAVRLAAPGPGEVGSVLRVIRNGATRRTLLDVGA